MLIMPIFDFIAISMQIIPGIYSIKSVGYISQVLNGNLEGPPVIDQREAEVPSQRWIISEAGSGYTIRNSFSGLYISSSGSKVILQGTLQEWDNEDESRGRFQIKEAGVGKSIELRSGANGTPVVIANYVGKSTQQWYFQVSTSGQLKNYAVQEVGLGTST